MNKHFRWINLRAILSLRAYILTKFHRIIGKILCFSFISFFPLNFELNWYLVLYTGLFKSLCDFNFVFHIHVLTNSCQVSKVLCVKIKWILDLCPINGITRYSLNMWTDYNQFMYIFHKNKRSNFLKITRS